MFLVVEKQIISLLFLNRFFVLKESIIVKYEAANVFVENVILNDCNNYAEYV